MCNIHSCIYDIKILPVLECEEGCVVKSWPQKMDKLITQRSVLWAVS